MSSDWRDRAACQGMDTNLFFPETYKPVSPRDQRRLRLVQDTCAGCPVRPECLAYAEMHREYGIWGGQNENQREGIRRRDRRRRARAEPALT